EPAQALGILHVGPPGAIDPGECGLQAAPLVTLAAVERNALGVLADAGHAIAEIGVVSLEHEVHAHERPADEICGERSDQRIGESDTHQEAGNGKATEYGQDEVAREVPE